MIPNARVDIRLPLPLRYAAVLKAMRAEGRSGQGGGGGVNMPPSKKPGSVVGEFLKRMGKSRFVVGLS